jgi:hypothetical protein
VAEKEIMEAINHPFIMKMHSAYQTADKLVFVLDFVSGGDLEICLQLEVRQKYSYGL